jgi:hypothetical protein
MRTIYFIHINDVFVVIITDASNPGVEKSENDTLIPLT